MPLKKPAAKAPAAKRGAAPKEDAPKKRAPKQQVVEDDDEDEETEEETEETEADEEISVEVGTGALKVLIRRSVTAKYDNGVLDNWVAEVTVDVAKGVSIDDIQAEINRGQVAAAFAIGAPYTSDEHGNVVVGVPKYNGKPVAGSGGGGAPKTLGGGKTTGGTTSGKARGGGGGGNANSGNYTDADKKALWDRFLDDVEEAGNEFPTDNWYDNTDGQYPNVKPKPKLLDELDINAEAKPLYIKNAPKKVQAMFDGDD